MSDVRDASVTLTWRAKIEPITGFLIEAVPDDRRYPTISKTVPEETRTFVLTGNLGAFSTSDGSFKRGPMSLSTHYSHNCTIQVYQVTADSCTAQNVACPFPDAIPASFFPHFDCLPVLLLGLQPGTFYTINMYTLNGNSRSPPFTLTVTTRKIQQPTASTGLRNQYRNTQPMCHFTIQYTVEPICYNQYSKYFVQETNIIKFHILHMVLYYLTSSSPV